MSDWNSALYLKFKSKLNNGGILAVQLPMNENEPLFRIIAEAASDSKWNLGNHCFNVSDTLSPDGYYDILSGCSSDFQLWETVYYHILPSHHIPPGVMATCCCVSGDSFL